MGTKITNRHGIAVRDLQNLVRLLQIGKKSEGETYIFPTATFPYLHKKTAGRKDIFYRQLYIH